MRSESDETHYGEQRETETDDEGAVLLWLPHVKQGGARENERRVCPKVCRKEQAGEHYPEATRSGHDVAHRKSRVSDALRVVNVHHEIQAGDLAKALHVDKRHEHADRVDLGDAEIDLVDQEAKSRCAKTNCGHY